ncbi:MAG: threonine synthase [Oscillospiraceae bacterium]|nr:threonine synthase [Oscillospiraceae bacterium]
MFYTSTRDNSVKVTASKAIADGISKEGGLYIPTEIPKMSEEEIKSLCSLNYKERAKKVLGLYLTDFTKEELDYCVEGAYADGKFSSKEIAPVVKLHDGVSILELFRGPTCAFKDMALQMLPYLLTVSAKKNLKDKEIVILVATSGDTGKAALEGFKDVEGTKILVFYPNDGVSPMQQLQMTTQEGSNVGVCAINGNFDDAQTGVKSIFTNKEILKRFEENNLVFSSANSINWGRLAPQIVYYFSAYCDMVNKGSLKFGDKMNVVVPTGNFGNILAAYFAKEMGLPLGKLICASNANNVLTDFIKTGTYDRNRSFYATVSPSMDILISSNLERLIYILSGRNDVTVNDLFGQLKDNGKYTVSDGIKAKVQELFWAGCCDDVATKITIGNTYKNYNYLADTHTAVAINVCDAYINETGDKTPVVVASTASPYKFSKSVLSAVEGDAKTYTDEFSTVSALEELTSVKAPAQLRALKGKEVRFNKVAEKDDMAKVVFDMLGI